MPSRGDMERVWLGRLAGAAATVLAGVALVALTVWIAGGDPRTALAALYRGSIGSRDSLAESLKLATPLLLTGLSVATAFQCKLWNIGSEGQFLAGLLAAGAFALLLPDQPAWVLLPGCLLAGMAAGALWASIPAGLKLLRDVPEVISTIMMNFVAVYLLAYLVRGPLRAPGTDIPYSSVLPRAAWLHKLGDLVGLESLGRGVVRGPAAAVWLNEWISLRVLHVGVLLAIGVALFVWLMRDRSVPGYQLRMVGINPAAAAAAGIRVGRTLLAAFLISGALAGLGGAVEAMGVTQRLFLYEPGAPGYGYQGIAVALLGRLHPVGVLLSALFFGALVAGSHQMERDAGISFQVAYIVQGALVLFLVGVRRYRA